MAGQAYSRDFHQEVYRSMMGSLGQLPVGFLPPGSGNLNIPTPSPSPRESLTFSSYLDKEKTHSNENAGKRNLCLEKDGKFASTLIKRMESKLNSEADKRSGEEEEAIKEEVLSEEENSSKSSRSKLDIKEDIKEENEFSSSCSPEEEDISTRIVGMVRLDMADSHSEAQGCRYCLKVFSSPVDLHQHER